MSFGHHRRKAARVAVLGSPGAMRAEGYAEESAARDEAVDRAAARRCSPTGAADGTFPLADPASRRAACAVGGLGRGRAQPDPRQAATGGGVARCGRSASGRWAWRGRAESAANRSASAVGQRPQRRLAVLDL